MADDKLILEIRLDDSKIASDFKKIETTAEKTANKIDTSLGNKNTGALVGLNDNLKLIAFQFGAVSAAAVSAGVAIKKGIDFVLLGEGAKAVENNFRNLADAAGLASGELKNAIQQETRGLIDTGEALQIATTGLIALGENAKALPQILGLARNASLLLGKDFKETFGNLSTFVETGNAKVLRQYGIILDTKAALDDYAKSVGTTTDKLSLQQEQAIRTNLLLQQTSKLFSSTGESSKPLSNALDRFGVALGNLAEDKAKDLDTKLSPSIVRVTDRFTDLIKNGLSASETLFLLTNPTQATAAFLFDAAKAADNFSNVGLRELKEKAEAAKTELENLNKNLAENKKLGLEKSNPLIIKGNIEDINAATEALKKLNFEILSRSQADVDAPANAAKPDALKVPKTPVDYSLVKQNEIQLTNFLSQQNIKRLQSDLETVNANDSFAQQRTSLLLLEQQQQKLLTEQHNQELLQIQNQFSFEKGFTKEQLQLAELAQDQAFKSQQLKIEQDTNDKIIELRRKEAEQTAIFAQYTVDSFAKIAIAAQKTLVVGVGNAFAKFGQALGRGEDASQAFADAIGATLAQAASDLGNFFIQSGIGRIAISYGTDPSGYAMLAAGIALNALSGFLGGAKSPGAGASDGGGIASSPGDVSTITPEQELTRAEPTTRVEVIVQGSIYDTSETGSRIVDLINSAFNEKGVVINSGAVA